METGKPMGIWKRVAVHNTGWHVRLWRTSRWLQNKSFLSVWPGQSKTELLFWSQQEVCHNLICHPVFPISTLRTGITKRTIKQIRTIYRGPEAQHWTRLTSNRGRPFFFRTMDISIVFVRLLFRVSATPERFWNSLLYVCNIKLGKSISCIWGQFVSLLDILYRDEIEGGP